jgi:hypothetical protein
MTILRASRPGLGLLLILLLVLLLSSACSTLEQGQGVAVGVRTDATGTDLPGAGEPRWQAIRFRFRGREAGQVDSYLDGLVADRVLAPLLEAQRERISLWRFHRRWPDDAVGHQFSFIYYAPPAVSGALRAGLRDHALLAALAEEGHLSDWFFDRLETIEATQIAATSDRRWPAALQREWPHFIMGSSHLWLGLVQDEAGKRPHMELHARYRAVEEALHALWYGQANHAFFHHISALFGYQPVDVGRHGSLTF